VYLSLCDCAMTVFYLAHQHVGWPTRLGGSAFDHINHATLTNVNIFVENYMRWVVGGQGFERWVAVVVFWASWQKGFCSRKPAKWLCKLLATIVLQIGQFIALLLLRVSSAAWLQFFFIYAFTPFCNSLFHYVACRNALVVADNCKFNHHIKFQVRPGCSWELWVNKFL